MVIKAASAGSMESNDVQVIISPGLGDVDIVINSDVKEQYGDHINRIIANILEQLKINNIRMILNDKGAMDFTIKARIIAALSRACEKDFLKEIANEQL